MLQLTKRIQFTCVFNPNLRIFDVVMRTANGTSYNSYVVQGTEKAALIDGAHTDFLSRQTDEITEALGGKAPDFLIVNHTEPDHAGDIAALTAAYPEMVIVTNAVAAKYLAQITNKADLKLRIIKDGDVLELGDVSLRFFIAPFLHWPDTMMTYCPEEKALFSCDVFGAHFCDTKVLDTASAAADGGAYLDAMKYYFDCIVSPFKSFAGKGLQKLSPLLGDLLYICPSHGLVLTKGRLLEAAVECYRSWSAPLPADAVLRIPIFYAAAYGNTKQIAEAIQAGIRQALPEAEASLYELDLDTDYAAAAAKLNASTAFLLGSPTINRDAVPPLWYLLAHADCVNIAKRPAALFGSYGWSGEACGNLQGRLEQLKCKVFGEPFKVNFVPAPEDLQAAAAFGAAFAASL
ncbi:MAG: FprA family A-type flavoprotein [Oscillospiraceae bacterium]|jgi:flavorubredoxin|nr:FprA family A-type flavoprotein [Oscillospiraceae bacterium]